VEYSTLIDTPWQHDSALETIVDLDLNSHADVELPRG
jgi:hypothetical protein